MKRSRGGLRLKVFLVLGALFLLAIGAQTLIVHFVVLRRFARMDARAAGARVHRSVAALHRSLADLGRLDAALAASFREAGGLRYAVPSPSELRRMRVDAALALSPAHRLAAASGFAHDALTPAEVTGWVRAHPALQPQAAGAGRSGMLFLHGTARLVAVRRTGDGMLVLVRSLSSARLAALAPGPGARLQIVARRGRAGSRTGVWRDPAAPGSTWYASLDDIPGGKGLLLRAVVPAGALAAGAAGLHEMQLLGALMAFAFFVTALLLFNRLVLARLANLGRQLRHVGQGGAMTVTDTAGADDELGSLAGSINSALAHLRGTEEALRESEEHFRTLAESIDGAIILHRNRILYCNPAACAITGYAEQELVGRPVTDLVPPEQRAEEHRRLEARLRGEMREDWRHEVQLVTRAGRVRWLDVSAALITYRGEPTILNACFDITEHKMIEAHLQQEKERAQVTLESIGDGVISTGLDGRIEFLNAVAEELTGWPAPEACGRYLTDVLTLIDESTRQVLENPAQECLQRGCRLALAGQAVLVPRGGEAEHSIEVTASPVRDHRREIVGVVLALHDVTALRGLARNMAYQASHDALTGLVNRREFETRLEQLVDAARRDGSRHALCYVDLDQFKVVNDTCGHVAGDALLRELSETVRRGVREGDTLARLGGDEFGLLFRDCDLVAARRLAEKLRVKIREFRFMWEGMVFDVGCSIGVVLISETSPDHTEVLSLADSACYLAKEQGRNRIHFHRPNDAALLAQQGEMRWMQRIQRAIEEERFTLYVQRIAPLGSASSIPAPTQEVLLRMIAEDGDVVLPSEFLAAAERYRLMPAIDRWVVREVARCMRREAAAAATPAVYSVNLSGQSLCDEGFLQHVTGLISDYAIRPERLCFELTETAVISNLAMARRFISVLRGLGCRFALDDFGSGLSSFAYLKNLPMDFLKIDGQFVRAMFTGRLDRAVVEAISDLGRVVNMRTIAEFVETEQLFHAVRRMGVDFAQGNYIEEPHPLYAVNRPAVPRLQ
ncbi:MAG TPA: EAL domain-containing protein [Gammaproteobacteria bacterium]|nr:EAL domain-containing protein [Gammaproteobacteria bacterium]